MSQANVDAVRRCFELFTRGDYGATLAYFDPAVETVEPTEMPDAASYVGYEGLAQAFSHFADAWAGYSVELEHVEDAGDQVLAVARYRATGKASGAAVETTVAHVYVFKGGKIVRWQMFNTERQALETVGLRE
jgi:uncharacterized protein